jgi:HNH endonuclease
MLSKHTRTQLWHRNGKKVRAHRWIMAQHLGRDLRADEEVHHVNHDPLDNRLENLTVLPRPEHVALHASERQKYPDRKSCVQCGTTFVVNPRKRRRHKCCSPDCAQRIRVSAALRARGIAA